MDTSNISSFLLTLPKEKGKQKKRRVWENDTWHRQPRGGVTGSGGNCMPSPQWGKPGATVLQPILARLALPDLPVTQEKTEKSQVLNAGNYLTFLRSYTKEGPPQCTWDSQPIVCPVRPLLGPFLSNIFIKNKSWFQLLPPVVHLCVSLFVLLLTFWFIGICSKYAMHTYGVSGTAGERTQWWGRQTLKYIKDDLISCVLGLQSPNQ